MLCEVLNIKFAIFVLNLPVLAEGAFFLKYKKEALLAI